MKTIRMLLLAVATLAGVLALGSSPASAQLPCPEGMHGGTTVWFTHGPLTGTGLNGEPMAVGVRCTKDGHLVGVTNYRLAGGDDDVVEIEDPSQIDDPCAGGWRYAYFVGGYFYCSKDGKMTYYLNA